MAEDTQNLTQGEKEALFQYLNQSQAAPIYEEKHNVHTFLFNVAKADDTTKVGFLKEEEVGVPKFPTRSFKSMALIAKKIIDNQDIADYFNAESEIVTSTSLSREGFLDKLAVTQTRQIADVTKPKTVNKSWFKSKKKPDGELEQ